MDWVQIMSAVGIGTLLAQLVGKYLDATLVSKAKREAEHERWLRDKRLEAYAEAAAEFETGGLQERGAKYDSLAARARVAKATILAGDVDLSRRFQSQICRLEAFWRGPSEKRTDEAINKLISDGAELVERMRQDLTATPQSDGEARAWLEASREQPKASSRPEPPRDGV